LIDHSLYPRLGLLDLNYLRKSPADLQVCLIVANSGDEVVVGVNREAVLWEVRRLGGELVRGVEAKV
jgi:hypothetical protein